MFLGYARASSGSALLVDQVAALYAAGCTHVFAEAPSRSKEQLAQAIQATGFGDTLMVTRLDRLACGTADLLKIYRKLAERGAGVRSLSESITDPTTEIGRFFPVFVVWCAEFDAATFAERMKTGRKRAALAGVKMGRPPKLTAAQRREAKALYERDDQSLDEIAKRYRVSASTLSRLLNKSKDFLG